MGGMLRDEMFGRPEVQRGFAAIEAMEANPSVKAATRDVLVATVGMIADLTDAVLGVSQQLNRIEQAVTQKEDRS